MVNMSNNGKISDILHPHHQVFRLKNGRILRESSQKRQGRKENFDTSG